MTFLSNLMNWVDTREPYVMKAAEFNRICPVGTPVNYHPIIGEADCKPMVVDSEAWELGSGQTVVSLQGKSGGVSLQALTFDCSWCKNEDPSDAKWYRFPLDQLGGLDQETNLPVCDNCADAAWEG